MQPSCFRYGDKTYVYSVRFLSTRKKTVSIHVHPDASVEVKAPTETSAQKIVEVITKRARWVVRHVEQMREHQSLILPREYISGESHFYLGRRYQLKVMRSKSSQVKLLQGYFRVEVEQIEPEHVKQLLYSWYQEHARILFRRRMREVVGSIPWVDEMPPLAVRLMAKQWGSCSPKGRISLNWHLAKAPLDCIDYVIMHELCHLKEHNHSKKFYALMDKLYPDWKPVKAKLDGMAEMLLNE